MIFNLKLGSLFSATDDYCLAHCVSSDFVLGAGIALQFAKLFNSKVYLNNITYNQKGKYPNCIRQRIPGRTIYHLVTKSKYFTKPSYNTISESLKMLKEEMVKRGEKKLAIPKIGCGLDNLEWTKVRTIINEIFADTDIEIIVYVVGE